MENGENGVFVASVSNPKTGLRATSLLGIFYGDGKIDSKETPQNRMINWEIVDAEEKMDSFSFTLANDNLDLFDSQLFLKGTEIEFQFGYPDNLSEKFKGVIDTRRGWRTMTVSGKFKNEISISNRQATQKWTNKSIKQVATELFEEEGLEAIVDSTLGTDAILPVIIRENLTVLQFLKKKAGEMKGDFHVYVEHNIGYFTERKFKETPSLTLKYGVETDDSDYRTIKEPNFSDEQESVATEESAKGMDILKKKPFEEKGSNTSSEQTSLGKGSYYFDTAIGGFKHRPAKEGKSGETGISKSTAKQTSETAKQKAQAGFDKKNSKAFKLTWSVFGDPKIKAKQVVGVKCDSKIISGNWYAKEVRHTCPGGAYDTSLTLIRNASGEIPGTEKATPKGGTNNKEAENRKKDQRTYAFDKKAGKFRPKL